MGIGYYSACKKCKKYLHIGSTGLSRNPLNLENAKMTDFVIRHASSCGKEHIVPLMDDWSGSEDINDEEFQSFNDEVERPPTVSGWKNRVRRWEDLKGPVKEAIDEIVSKMEK